jgi:hypothetical protein
VAKKAAVEALTLAGQAYRPGVTSQSVSRDGVSESVSYNATQQGGVYGATITAYKEWLEKNLASYRGAFRGPTMVVL